MGMGEPLLNFDAVLTATNVTLAPGLPNDCFLNFDFPIPGVALLAVSCITPISGTVDLLNIEANVNAGPGAQTPLDLVAGQVNEIDACLEAGMNDYIPKPYKIEEFIPVLYKNAKKNGEWRIEN